MNNKGQVTIFVIIAVIIVAVIAVLMLINRGNVSVREQDFDNPESYLSTCIRERVIVAIDEMLPQAGFINSEDRVLYNGKEITYLCKNINNFEPCINQYPMYASQLEDEFNKNIKDDVEQCYSSLKQAFSDRNYDVSDSGNLIVESSFKPEVVSVVLKTDITISKGDESKKFSRFDTFVPSKIQGIAFVANEIVAQEAKWCYFNSEGFVLLYPEYDVRAYTMEDTTKIYTVKNKETSETLTMAVRGCALPAGWF